MNALILMVWHETGQLEKKYVQEMYLKGFWKHTAPHYLGQENSK